MFWNADEAASVYARARAVVSLDCHSPIIALTAREPAIAAQKVHRAMTFVRQRQAAMMASVRAALPA